MAVKRNPGLKKSNTVINYTLEQVAEVKKCIEDPVYFIEKYVWIKHPIRGRIPFKLYDYQKRLIHNYRFNRYNIVLSARQTGKTETSCAFLLWFAIFHTEKTVLVVSNKGDNAKEIIGKIQYAYEELPSWLKPGIQDDNWNKHTCAFDNKSRIIATTTSKDSGRGLPISLLYCDEMAHVKEHIQNEFWDSIYPTLSTGGACIISSTPNGDINLFAELWRGADLGANTFVPTRIPWDAPPGRDEDFKKEKISVLGLRKWLQEYECEFLSTEATLFDGKIISLAEVVAKKHAPYSELDGQVFYHPIVSNATYIVTVDPSNGNQKDFSVIQVFRFPSMEQVTEFRTNTLSQYMVYNKLKQILKLLEHYTKNIYLAIENNGVGQGIISLYQADETPPKYAYLLSDAGKDKYGYFTGEREKIKACINFKNMFEKGAMKIYSLILLKEMKSYKQKGNTYTAATGATDDCISTILLLMRVIEDISTHDPRAFAKLYVEEISAGDSWVPKDDDDSYDGPAPMIIS
jgi:hypothetical protein